MKQHITEEQLDELTKKQSEKIHEWYGFPKGASGHNRELALQLSIGKLIEFLDECINDSYFSIGTQPVWGGKDGDTVIGHTWCVEEYENNELCDALWEAVKESLL